MPARRRLLIVLLLVLVAGAVVLGFWLHRRADTGASDRLVLHGNVDIRQVELAFIASGRIDRLLVAEGDRVRKGQLLAALDTERLSEQVAQAEAQVASQRQVVARLEAGSRPEEIRKAQADVQAARVDAANALAHYRRQEELVAQHFVAQQQLDDARFALDAARARLKAAEEALRLVELGPRAEDVAAAKATLKAYEAAAAVARRDLRDGSLVAPSDGVIENRVLEVGDMASPQKPVFTLALTSPVWVRTYVAEPDLAKVHLGARAEVTTDSYPDQRERAWVGFISPTAQFTPKSVETREVRTALVYQLRVFVCDPRQQLRLGMPATVVIPLGEGAPAAVEPGADPCKDGQ